ncbi:MAG: pectate lyase [Pedobacter sp.]|nr:MAG: pectate lyase [Pedobacter sp.]
MPTPVPVNEIALAFPGAEGYGKNTTGGRGGKIIKVTNLNDDGPGSLRAAVNESGARIIVFEVSGNIQLKSRLLIRNGNLTIAGQSAPGEGICIQDYEMQIDADNVIIRFMRFRMGDLTRNEQDAFWGRFHSNIIIDHCSMSWSIDECASFYANQNFSLQWCILSESLNQSFHGKSDHGYGAIWGGNKASFHHNLLAHHNSRTPRFDGGKRSGTTVSPFGTDLVDFRNNVIYNWGDNSAYGGENGEYNMVNNYYKAGPGTPANRSSRFFQITSDPTYAPGYGKFYIAGNVMHGQTGLSLNNWAGGVDRASSVSAAQFELAKANTAFSLEPIPEHTALQAYEKVLQYAGASLVRDAIDTRISLEVQQGTASFSGSKTGKKGIIDSQTDVGGWPIFKLALAALDSDGDGMPDEWEIRKGLDPKVANASGRNLSTGYDNIEVYLNELVKNITDNQYK